MVRLSLSFVLAAALILAGALQAVEITEASPLKFTVSALVIGLGLVWLWATFKEWRTR